MKLFSLLIFLQIMFVPDLHAASLPVTLKAEKTITLDNGLVRLELNDKGKLTGLFRNGGSNLAQRGYWNCNANGYDKDGTQMKQRFATPEGKFRIVRSSADLVEIAFDRPPKSPLLFKASLHYVLRRGDSGFYIYMTLSHDSTMPPGTVTQYAYNLRLNPSTFKYIAVDEKRRHISHSSRDEDAAESIMDAAYRLNSGQVVSKYNYTHAIEDDAYRLYGWASAKAGVWWIQPSAEYYGSTPFRVLLTSHQTSKSPILIWQAHCLHRGGYLLDFPASDKEDWSKLYGPVFVYLNSGSNYDAMWKDATTRVALQKNAWPYSWMEHKEFRTQRGSVSGALIFDNGLPAVDAWVILSPRGTHWSKENKGYHFWIKTDKEGHFTINKVRPGDYSLTAAGADQFYEFKKMGVEVSVNKTTTLDTLTWKRVIHGKREWQIGKADRSTGEFRNGSDFHHWGVWRRYPTDFPEDINFIIGKSKEESDWNYIHWNWYSERNAWAIRFDLDTTPKGTATLTFGIAGARGHGANGFGSSNDTSLQVFANNAKVGKISTPSTGGDSYRSARQSTRYSVKEIKFNANILHKGQNVITLSHDLANRYKQGESKGESGAGPGCIMYDAIRLEIE
jgi:rhamnogalacturonan endolyase